MSTHVIVDASVLRVKGEDVAPKRWVEEQIARIIPFVDGCMPIPPSPYPPHPGPYPPNPPHHGHNGIVSINNQMGPVVVLDAAEIPMRGSRMSVQKAITVLQHQVAEPITVEYVIIKI